MGNDDFGADLRALEGFKVAKRKISVRRYASAADLEKKYAPCDLLLISRTSTVVGETTADRLAAATKVVKDESVILVTDAVTREEATNLARKGAHVSFYNDFGARLVKMIVNEDGAKSARLKVRSELMKLRNIVSRL